MANKQSTAKEIVLPLSVSVAESTYKQLSETIGKDGLNESLGVLISDFLMHFANGGFLVTASDVEHMSQAAGERIDTSQKVVKAVDKVSGRKAGAYEFRVNADPNMIDVLNDVANSRGMTLEEVVQEAWNSVTAAGWLYSVPVPCEHFFINEAQHKAISKILGKNGFSGTDISYALVQAHKKLEKEGK